MKELDSVGSRLELLAEILGLSPRRIQQLVEDGILPKPDKPGAYDIPTCVRDYYYNEFASDCDEELNGQYERARKAKVEADRIEFDLKIKQGQYLQADLVGNEIEKAIVSCRAKLLAIPRKLAPIVAVSQNPNEVEDVLANEITDVLNDLVKPGFNDAIARTFENTQND